MTIMAVCDAKHKFVIVEAGASGKRADANIFYKSAFAKGLRKNTMDLPPSCPVDGVEGNMPFYFVGDNAYPLSQHLATPFKGDKLSSAEVYFCYNFYTNKTVLYKSNSFWECQLDRGSYFTLITQV